MVNSNQTQGTDPVPDAATVRDRMGLLEALKPFLPRRVRLAQLAALSFVSGLAQAAMLVLLVHVAIAATSEEAALDLGLGPLDAGSLSVPWALALAVGLALLALLLQFFGARLMATLSASTLASERRRLFDSFMQASWPVKAQQRDGHLQELFANHATKSANAVVWVAAGLDATFSLGALLIGAFVIEPVATAGAIVLVTGLFFALRPLAAKGRRYAAQQAIDGVAMSTAVTEFAGISLETTVFDVRAPITEQMDTQIDIVSDSFRRMKFVGKMVPDLYRSAAFLLILIGLAAAYAADAGNVAALGAVVLLLLRGLGYTQVLQRTSVHLQQLVPYLEQLNAEHLTLRESAPPSGSQSIGVFTSVEFRGVKFEYEPGVPALSDVSFFVEAGETIGIVGPSGSGKSTLFQILMRLRDPNDGTLLLNDQDALSFDRSDWYRQIAVLPQDSRLFKGTVRDNIAFYRDLSDDDVKRAARMAHIDEDIMTWPTGYETDVGQRGSQLSGGQRQRLYLARALAGRPQVLFLDEPTSALDVLSEAHIQHSLDELQGEITMFIIAHRLSTISMCDRVMVFEGGRLVAFDSRDALETSNAFYQRALSVSVGTEEVSTMQADGA